MKHPEVKYIGFLTLLYAGTTSLVSFNYSILNYKVKMLEQWSLSAGNPSRHSLEGGTSETLRNGIVSNTENVKLISVHNTRHLKPLSDNQFGHYLAGLIDGDGHFSSEATLLYTAKLQRQQLVIAFDSSDVSLAYYIRTRLGFGSVKEVKSKKIILLIITKRAGLEKVLNLINGKLRTQIQYDAVKNYILNGPNFSLKIDFKLNDSNCLNNHWLAGFSDASATFQIINLKTRIKLALLINKDNKELLILIRNFWGGNLSYNKAKDSYTYDSSSYGSARKIIKYFDKFHLQSSKYIDYIKWRKVYVLVQNKDHLTDQGIKKIIKLKNSISNLNNDTIQDKVLTKM